MSHCRSGLAARRRTSTIWWRSSKPIDCSRHSNAPILHYEPRLENTSWKTHVGTFDAVTVAVGGVKIYFRVAETRNCNMRTSNKPNWALQLYANEAFGARLSGRRCVYCWIPPWHKHSFHIGKPRAIYAYLWSWCCGIKWQRIFHLRPIASTYTPKVPKQLQAKL